MRKRNFVLVMAFALAVVLTTGGLLASNMGFKITYTLNGAGSGGWVSNENTLALPFLPQIGITNASTLQGDLMTDCGLTPLVQRFEPTLGIRQTWFGGKIGGTNFAIPSGCECYFIQMPAASTCPYVAVGSHHPTRQCTFNGAGVGGWVVGENTYGAPYHVTATNAADLRTQIGANVSIVQRYEPTTGARESWFGAKIGGTNFALSPGECYFLQMTAGTTTTITPVHY